MLSRRELSDAEVVRRVLSGRRELFGILVERYLPAVHAIAYARTGRRMDAEDVAQESFLRSLQSLPSLKEPQKFGAWLAGITRNVASIATRSAVRRDRLHERLDLATVESPLPSMERNEMHELLRAQVMALDEGPREILLLHYFAGKGVHEIANVLDISVEAAKKRLQRAREQLGANVMQELGPAFAPEHPSRQCVTKIMAAVGAAHVVWQAGTASAAAATPGVVGWTTVGGVIAVKKSVFIAVLVALAAGGVWVSTREDSRTPMVEPTAAGAQTSTPATPGPATEQPTAEVAKDDTAPASPGAESATESIPDSSRVGLGVVTGRVVDAKKRPAANATVTLYTIDDDAGTRELAHAPTTTNGQGEFEFKGLPFEIYAAVAEAPNGFGADTLQLGWERPKVSVTIELAAGGTIAGRVKDDAGKPVANARIYPIERAVNAGWIERFLAVGMQGVSGADGGFIVSGLEPPAWKLVVTADGYATQRTDAFAVGTQSAEIVLKKGTTVEGTVAMADTGAPVSGAAVSLDMRWPDRAEAESGADGTFRFTGVGEGEYVVEVDKETLVPSDAPVRLKIADGQDVARVAVGLVKGGVIAGRLYDTVTKEGLPGLTVRARGEGSPDREGTSDEEGMYRLEGLVSTRYDLSAERPDGYLNPGYGNEQVVQAKIGEVVENIDFAMTRGTMVAGRVGDGEGKPVANARVDVSPASWHVTATTSDDGLFELSPLEPTNGLYINAVSDTMACNPQGPFRVPQEGLRDVEIVVGPSGSISGKLVNSQGAPVVDMELHAWPMKSPGGFFLPTATTNVAGEFSINDLAPNTFRMVASPPGSSSIGNNELDRVELAQGQVVSGLVLVYDENAGYTISGHVLDSEGQPLQGATVQCEGPVSGAGVTDANGYYEASRLSEGLYHVSVRSRHGSAERSGVVAGTEGVDLTIPARSELALFMVSGGSGTPVTSFEYCVRGGIMQDLEPFYLQHELQPGGDPNGMATTEAPVGDVTVFARAPGHMLSKAFVTVRQTADGPTEATVALAPAETLELLVTDEGGTPIAGAEAYLGEIEVYGKPSNRYAFPIGLTGEDGRLVYDMLDPAYASVYVMHADYAPGAAPIAAGSEVHVALPGGGVVEGIVTQHGQPVDPSLCSVSVSYPDNPGLGKSTYRAESFPYRMEGVVPGNVVVEAIVYQREPSSSSHSVFRTATVVAGQTTIVDIEVPAWDAAIAGRVHEDGLATVEAVVSVSIVTADGREERFEAQTDDTGNFVIPNVPPGNGTIDVLLWEHWIAPVSRRRLGPEPITTTAGETTTVEFDFGE